MRRAAFTLIELLLVMALLVVLLAVIAPTLSNSLRGRGLAEEAKRFVALTEYARTEAVSQGVPTVVWIEPSAGRYGMEVKAGYENIAANSHAREYTMAPDSKIELTKAPAGNHIIACDFAADGVLAPESAETVRFIDRYTSTATVARSHDGWGYEVEKGKGK